MKPKKRKDDSDYIVKVLCIGDSGVGKTNILMRACDNYFTMNYAATIGVDFKIKIVDVDGKKIKLQVWDTAGQQRYKNINQTYYKGAIGVILVYAINDRASFTNVENWLKQINESASANIVKYLVANKTDLYQDRKINFQQGKQLADRFRMSFKEVSAKDGTNIQELFGEFTRQILNQIKVHDRDDLERISLGNQNKENDNNGGCKC